MSTQYLRSFLNAAWRYATAEAARLLLSAVLAVGVTGYFMPGMDSFVSLRTLSLLTVSLLRGEDNQFDWKEELGGPIIVLVLLTICIRIALAAVPRLLSWIAGLQSGDAALPETAQSSPLHPHTAALNLRLRARQQRRSGQILIGMIAVLVLLGFVMFQGAERSVMALYYNFSAPLEAQVQNLNSEITNLTLGPASDPKIGAALAQKREQLRHAETKLDELSPFRSLSMYLLFVLSTKIAAIVFLVFLVQLLGNIYRYLTRLAFSLDSRADVLEFAETTPNTAMLIAMFLPEKSVEMDQMPAFPVLDQLKGAPKTLGGRG